MNANMIAFGSDHFDSMHIVAIGPASAAPRRDTALLRTGPDWEFPELRRVCCTSEQATQIVADWNSLPAAEQARCHEPGFAIELFRGSESIFVAALCWECNDISIGGVLATMDWRVFDTKSIAASSLLNQCRRVTASVS